MRAKVAGLVAAIFASFAVLTIAPGVASAQPVTATEGAAFSGLVATYATNCTAPVSNPSATINWGDGSQPASASVSVSGTDLQISGTHTWAEEGTPGGTITGSFRCGVGQAQMFTASFTAAIADASLATPANIDLGEPQVSATATVPFHGAVASFLDADPSGAASDYTATIHWGDGSQSTTGSVAAANQGFEVDGGHTYAAAGSYPVSVDITDAGGSSIVAHTTATVIQPPPATVDFTFSPDTVPVLSHYPITFTVSSPSPGAVYQWDFGDAPAESQGFGSSPFTVQATGGTVSHSFADPPAQSSAQLPGGIGIRRATYQVRLRVTDAGGQRLYASAAHQLTIVPDTAPSGQFEVVRHTPSVDEPDSTAVTHPVVFVPEATIPQQDANAPNRIVREDWWFDSQGPPAPPDLTCLPDGTCGHYDGSALIPASGQLTPVPGLQDLGTQPVVVQPAGLSIVRRRRMYHGQVLVAPTGGFEAFSVDFWTRALAGIGAPGGAATLPPTNLHEPVVGYPPLSSVDLGSVSGAFWPGYPTGSLYQGMLRGSRMRPAISAPVVSGPDPARQEFEWDFLYNYSTVVGVDTSLDSRWGPATGTRPGFGNSTLVLASRQSRSGAIRVGGGGGSVSTGHGSQLMPRTVTMVAYDAGGVASDPVTQSVALTPASHPSLSLQLVVDGQPVHIGGQTSYPIYAGDTLRLDPTGSSGGDDPILYYGLETGQPKDVVWAFDGSKGPGYHLWQPGGPLGPSQAQSPVAAPSASALGALCEDRVNQAAEYATGVPGPVHATSEVPNFSDLLDGVSPYHDCAGYLRRSVDPTLAPEALPPSMVKQASRDVGRASARAARAGAGGHGGAILRPGGIELGNPANCASAAADPALVTTDASALCFRFDRQGIYSLAAAAYNTSGLGAITRIDGFVVLPAIRTGKCQQITSRSLRIGGDSNYGFSGSCVSVGDVHGGRAIYVSADPIDVNGTTLAPAPGDEIVIDNEGYPSGDSQVFAQPVGGQGTCDYTNGQGNCDPLDGGGTVYLEFGGDRVGVEHAFNAATAAGLLTPSNQQVTGCGGVGDGDQWAQPWDLPNAATYQGFAVATRACVLFARDGSSRSDFFIQLPAGVTGPQGSAAQSHVVLEGKDVPPTSDLTSTPFANVARADSVGASRVVAGQVNRGPIAHGADFGKDFVPNCDAVTEPAKLPQLSIHGSQAIIPGGTTIGPITLPKQVSLCFDNKNGDFIAEFKITINGPTPINGVDFGLEIGNGGIKKAAGEISGDIPVFTGLDLTKLGFGVEFSPTRIEGLVGFDLAKVLGLEGDFTATIPDATNAGDFQVGGTLSLKVLNLELAEAHVDWSGATNNLTVGAKIGKDFGVASLEAELDGGVHFADDQHPDFEWYLEGQGHACIGPCLNVNALAGSKAIAACGEYSFFGLKLGAGFAVVYGQGAKLFTGCDLGDYIPPAFPKGEQPSSATDPAPLQPGQSEQFTLCPSPPGQPACSPTTAAVIQVHALSNAAPGGAPQAPQVELDGPDGRVITMPANPGDYSAQGTAFVDQNPIAETDPDAGPYYGQPVTTTAVIVSDPAPGLWTLKILSGSPAVVSQAVAYSQPPLEAHMFNANVKKATITQHGGGLMLRIGQRSFTRGGLVARAAAAGAGSEFLLAPSLEATDGRSGLRARAARARSLDSQLSVPQLDLTRLRGVIFKAPSSLGSDTVTLLDEGPGGNQVLAAGLSKRQIPSTGLPIAFLPAAEPGAEHQIKAFITNPDGIPRTVLTLSSYRTPAALALAKPKIDKIVRDGQNVDVYLSPADIPILASAPTIALKISASDGERFNVELTAAQLRPVGPPHGLGLDKQATEYQAAIPGVDPTAALTVTVGGFFEGKLGQVAHRSVAPAIPGVNEAVLQRQFAARLRAHQHQHR